MVKNKVWIFDFETYKNLCCVTFLSLLDDELHCFVIDEYKNESDKIIEFSKGKVLIGYNNKGFDNLVLNYIYQNPHVSSYDIQTFATNVIRYQNKDGDDFYKLFRPYFYNKEYQSIDLMRMLFSKKLRVGLKELECSLNFKNVEELPYPYDAELTEEQKQKIIAYNLNDCEATKLVTQKSKSALTLRKWTLENFKVDGYSLDGVNLGVKILERKLGERLGNYDFVKHKTDRKIITVKNIIYPFIKFETPEFQEVLSKYQKLRIYKYFDKKENKDKWTKFSYEPEIKNNIFKYGLGGLHFDTKCKSWYSNDEYDVLSIDVASFYPAQVREFGKVYNCKPQHLPDEFVDVYVEIINERLKAKAEGDDIKNETYKLSINGAFGNMANINSWLCDVQALLTITINGQLMLSMLCEKLMKENIKLIDVNTDGVYLYLHKSKRAIFDKIVEEWSALTKMELEETKFERLYFLTTADYFGTYLKKGKLLIKEKGSFITETRLGKGKEFPVIYNAVREHFLNNVNFTTYIKEHKEILDFCSYKKLTKKNDTTCFWKGEKQQLVNRYYASRAGAHLYRRKWDAKNSRYQTDHILKDSPVLLLNKLDNKPISSRQIYYPFYLSKAREIITQMDGDQGQMTIF